ncbi:hypothetical protein FRC01_001136 [Tulasnella sp. 417]|nr:hypothetical protein FRC01_001136 [Tulasnella sp. 417]
MLPTEQSKCYESRASGDLELSEISVPPTTLQEPPFSVESHFKPDERAPMKVYGDDQSNGAYLSWLTRALMTEDVKRYRRTRGLLLDLVDVAGGLRNDALDVLKQLCEVLWGYPILVKAFNESKLLPHGYRIESDDWNIVTLSTPGGRVFRLTEDGFTQGTSGTSRAAA